MFDLYVMQESLRNASRVRAVQSAAGLQADVIKTYVILLAVAIVSFVSGVAIGRLALG